MISNDFKSILDSLQEFDIITLSKRNMGYVCTFMCEVVAAYVDGESLTIEYVLIKDNKKSDSIDEFVAYNDSKVKITKGDNIIYNTLD